MRVHDLDARFSDSVDNVRSGREPAWLGTRYESCCAGARGFRLGPPAAADRSTVVLPASTSSIRRSGARRSSARSNSGPPQPRRVDAAAIVVGDDPGRVRDAGVIVRWKSAASGTNDGACAASRVAAFGRWCRGYDRPRILAAASPRRGSRGRSNARPASRSRRAARAGRMSRLNRPIRTSLRNDRPGDCDDDRQTNNSEDTLHVPDDSGCLTYNPHL